MHKAFLSLAPTRKRAAALLAVFFSEENMSGERRLKPTRFPKKSAGKNRRIKG
jgi:hypothetical protein